MSRSMRIKGPSRIEGALSVPGDKSISHRIAMLASVANGTSRVTGLASSADCKATLSCLRKLGINVEHQGSELLIHGRGLSGYHPAESPVELDAGNSGSTIRMLSGLLAGQTVTSRIDGDASLRRRPMARIVEPLRLMGALIEATDGNFPPLTIRGRTLKAIDYPSPVASAQVKSCVLLAGLLAEGHTSFFEPALSRNHTELMLKEFGARIEVQASRRISIEGLHELKALDYRVPGDISSAAFFIAAAALLPGSGMKLNNVNLNPTRTGFLDILCELGARIERLNVREQHGETVGDLVVVTSQLTTPQRGLVLSGEVIPNIIDEIPIIAIVATQVEGRVEVRDAKELRIKESDRIRTVADGIKAIGGEIEEREDGFVISGPQKLVGGTVDSAGDHRIAMAFSIAGLIADGITEVVGADCASVSFPEFYESLDRVTSSDDAVQPSAGCDRMSPSSFTQHASAPVFLVGFMGAGKTTVGRALAEYLGYEFLDLDELIEARAGKSVQTIFAQSGEAVFRGLERKAIRDCVGHTRAVIALGGGAYASEENRSLLRKTGKTVWLDCPLEICLRRISGDVSRPLLGDEHQMRELHEARRGSYAQADIIVHTGEHSPDQLVREIAKSLDA